MRLLSYAIIITAICLADVIIPRIDTSGHEASRRRNLQLSREQVKVVSKIPFYSLESSYLTCVASSFTLGTVYPIGGAAN